MSTNAPRTDLQPLIAMGALEVQQAGPAFARFAHHVRKYVGEPTSAPVPKIGSPSDPMQGENGKSDLPLWIEEAARACGFRAEPVALSARSLATYLCSAGPALVQMEGELATSEGATRTAWLYLLPEGDNVVIVSDGSVLDRKCTLSSLIEALERPLQEKIAGEYAAVLEALPMRSRKKLLHHLLLRSDGIPGVRAVYSFRRNEPDAILSAPRTTRRTVGKILLAYSAQFLLVAILWGVLFRETLRGQLEMGTVIGATLLVFALQVLRMGSENALRQWGIQLGVLLRTTLLARTTKGDPDRLRAFGFSSLLAGNFEAEMLEERSIELVSFGVLAVLELGLAALCISFSPDPFFLLLLSFAAFALLGVLAKRLQPTRLRWTKERLRLTSLLSEQLVGQTTETVQGPPEGGDRSADALKIYAAASEDYDHRTRELKMLAQAFKVFGAIALFLFAFRDRELPVLSLVALLVTAKALQTVSSLVVPMSLFQGSLGEIEPLLDPKRGEESAASRAHPHIAASPPGAAMPLVIDKLSFLRDGGRPILQDLQLTIEPNEKCIVTGGSGCGKSTLLSILAGVRSPTAGSVSVGGLDPGFLGDRAWRKRVVYVPQFHENHVFSETFLFNLLMGKRWPPQSEDVEEAVVVCEKLGLGPLLAAMPGGFQQMVGESGWQLSHGEKSRLYLARGLLQQPDYLLLDESFGALDPETLKQCIEQVRDASKGLVIVAHP